ncbi:MAG: hypothetical protein IT578_12425 [Verrucomicrobiae bacterium]|nr:hypothetical protein [Verrucomicrobiae bacterium]
MNSLRLLAAVCTAALAAGCASGPYASKTDRPNLELESEAPVVFLNKDLRRVLDTGSPVATRTAAKALSVQVALRNRTDDEILHLQAQTLFKDDQGRVLYSQIGSEPVWQPMVLTPGQTVYYTQSALTPEAVKFVVRVRYAPGRVDDDDKD